MKWNIIHLLNRTGVMLGGLLSVVSHAAATNQAKPNIVYILCGDLGYGDVQCLNPERGKIALACIWKWYAGTTDETDQMMQRALQLRDSNK